MNITRIAALAVWLLSCLGQHCRGAEVAWPGIEYATVRAYLYNQVPISTNAIEVGGGINPSVEGVATLTKAQALEVEAALRPQPEKRGTALCFLPHHAIVYFDRNGKSVASLLICFQCGNEATDPPIPDTKAWDQDALKALLKTAGIPVPGEPAYAEFEERGKLFRAERERLAKSAGEKLGKLGFDHESGVPPVEAAWPWRPFAKAMLYAYNADNQNERIVLLGKINPSVTKEVELSPAQLKETWTAFRKDVLAGSIPGLPVLPGEEEARDKALATMKDWVPGPRKVRHALVCFDDKGVPVAWLQLSFSDATYFASPADDLLSDYHIRWSPHRLAELFPKMGIPVEEAKSAPKK